MEGVLTFEHVFKQLIAKEIDLDEQTWFMLA
jgi:hypothetical protein